MLSSSTLCSTLFLTTLISTTFSSPLTSPSPSFTCTDIVIPITFSAQNIVVPPVPFPNGTFPTAPVAGTYDIAARYCEPDKSRYSKRQVLQVLVHGLTYTRNYWSGAGDPGHGFDGDEYSWIAYAASRGYTTLSIDRLGNGLSPHPDPVSIVQINAQVSILHQLILAARGGQLTGPAADRKFNTIVYAGHSFGSIMGNSYNTQYPTDVDATILTGWGTQLNVVASNAVFSGALASAALVDPERWSGLDEEYLVFNGSADFTTLFYNEGYFDPKLKKLDYTLRGTLALGESLSAQVEPAALAPDYAGSVLVLTGQRDFIFCPPALDGTADCGTGWASNLTASKNLYPAAKSFASYALPNRGHCWNYHYGAKEGFKIAHDWIEELRL